MQWRYGVGGLIVVALAACGVYGSGDDDDDHPSPVTPPAKDAGGGGLEASAPIVIDDAGVPHVEVKQVVMGFDFGCALLADSSLWCWGDNSYGQLARPPTLPDASDPGLAKPMKVEAISDVKAIAAGDRSMCAIKNDASLWCWGRNDDGELGRASDTDQTCASNAKCNHVPSRVGNLTVSSVTSANGTACALTTANVVYCWGKNNLGQCGRAPSAVPSDPVLPDTISGLGPMTSVRLGYRAFTACAIDASKHAWCWGRNYRGTLGHTMGTSGDLPAGQNFYNPKPVKIDLGQSTDFGDLIDIVTGETICAVKTGGNVYCWGSNDGNLLVRGTQADALEHPNPVVVPGLLSAAKLGAGNTFCALLGTGEVNCWGPGSLATASAPYDGSCTNPTDGKVACRNPAVIAGPRLKSLDVTRGSAGGVTVDGFAVTWGGAGYGRLGHPPSANPDDDLKPQNVIGLP